MAIQWEKKMSFEVNEKLVEYNTNELMPAKAKQLQEKNEFLIIANEWVQGKKAKIEEHLASEAQGSQGE